MPATNVAKSGTQQTSAPPLSVSAITASNLDTNRTGAHSHAPLRQSSATHAPALDTSRLTAQPSVLLEPRVAATLVASQAILLATAAHHLALVEWLLEWVLALAVVDSLLAADSRVDLPHAEELSRALAQPPATSAVSATTLPETAKLRHLSASRAASSATSAVTAPHQMAVLSTLQARPVTSVARLATSLATARSPRESQWEWMLMATQLSPVLRQSPKYNELSFTNGSDDLT